MGGGRSFLRAFRTTWHVPRFICVVIDAILVVLVPPVMILTALRCMLSSLFDFRSG